MRSEVHHQCIVIFGRQSANALEYRYDASDFEFGDKSFNFPASILGKISLIRPKRCLPLIFSSGHPTCRLGTPFCLFGKKPMIAFSETHIR